MSTKRLGRPLRPEPKGTGSATFGAKVQAARVVLKWNQTELAVRSGLTQRAVYGIEAEINRPRKATQSQILGGLRIDDTFLRWWVHAHRARDLSTQQREGAH